MTAIRYCLNEMPVLRKVTCANFINLILGVKYIITFAIVAVGKPAKIHTMAASNKTRRNHSITVCSRH